MKRLSFALLCVAGFGVVLAAQAKPQKPLEIYVIDVEGGKSDLWVTPAGQAVLIDTASGGSRSEPNPGCDQGGQRHEDRLHDHHALSHGPCGQPRRNCQAHSDHELRRSRRHDRGAARRRTAGADSRVLGVVSLDLRQGHAHQREAGRQAAHHRPRLAHCHVEASGHQERVAGGPKRGQAGPYCAGTERRTVTLDPDDGASVGSVVTTAGFARWISAT